MKRKGRYTYVPKDEIAEVRTFNDVSFETDDLLDGAYVKGRKKYARGGMPSKRPMSLEEQAAESVGYDTWYMMDAVDQKELVDELVSTGMIAPMYGWGGKMADGGKTNSPESIWKSTKPIKRVKMLVNASENKYTSDELVDFSYLDWASLPKGIRGKLQTEMSKYADGGEIYKMADNMTDAEYQKKLSSLNEKQKKTYDILVSLGDSPKLALATTLLSKEVKWDDDTVRAYTMADGGLTDSEREGAIEEASKIATFAIDNDITASGKSLKDFSNEIFEASGISYGISYLRLAYDALAKNNFADGGEISYVVKYSMKDTPEIVKEKVFADKDAAELFHETISDDDDLVVMDLQEIKPAPASAPKKSLFASAKPAPATTAASKKKRERVQVDGIEGEIARYDQLKAAINNAKAEQEVIGGRLKEIGREKFLELYEQRGVRPANFDLADGNENILLEVTDKYLKVEPEKAELLRQFDGLLEEKTTYEFDSELLEKEVSDGMTIGDVVSMLIQDSKLIPESDKPNLIKAKMSMRVPKGTIDRLMDYDNPREVFSLISPILALK